MVVGYMSKVALEHAIVAFEKSNIHVVPYSDIIFYNTDGVSRDGMGQSLRDTLFSQSRKPAKTTLSQQEHVTHKKSGLSKNGVSWKAERKVTCKIVLHNHCMSRLYSPHHCFICNQLQPRHYGRG